MPIKYTVTVPKIKEILNPSLSILADSSVSKGKIPQKNKPIGQAGSVD